MGTTKSTTITALDASPSTVPNVRNSHGRLMQKVETIETPAASSANQQLRFFRVNAQDRITRISVQCDATAGLTESDLGIYDINGGAVVDIDCYIDGLDWHTAGLDDGTTAPLNYAFEIRDISAAKQLVWEDAGVSVDPGNKQYDLVLTNVSDVDAIITMTVAIEYVSGS
jgi:hypothetical protein